MARNGNVSVGFDAFDRANDSYEFDSRYASNSVDSVNTLAYSMAPMSRTVNAMDSTSAKTISALTIDDNKLTATYGVNENKIDTLGEKFEELSAAIKKLGSVMGVDPFKNSKIDFKVFKGAESRLKRSELKTV